MNPIYIPTSSFAVKPDLFASSGLEGCDQKESLASDPYASSDGESRVQNTPLGLMDLVMDMEQRYLCKSDKEERLDSLSTEILQQRLQGISYQKLREQTLWRV